MSNILLSPPFAFPIVLLFVMFLFRQSAVFSAIGKITSGKNRAYGCGEDNCELKVRPEYSSFFSIAFFFTIMHFVVLMIATLPKITLESLLIAVFYLLCAMVCTSMLFRE
ncbi:MAG: hypothetical protein HQM10_18500 [Candidatus Riflebacteria bacterium]|nr:hypothetical protein [Candidatus Riflebacteria bacterium]